MTSAIKVFRSTQAGAPVLTGQAGTLLGVLRTCLVTGFGLKSVVNITVASGVATAAFSSGHSFAPGSVALLAGASPPALNGEKLVLTTAANSITFAAAGVADGAATGSISAKVASAGWAEMFSGTATNVGVFKPTAPEASGCVLRVDDTETMSARVVGYESKRDVNTGIGPFPSDTQFAGGQHWAKSLSGDTTPIEWEVIADDRAAYLITAFYMGGGPYVGRSVFFFGDFTSQKSGDAYSAALFGAHGQSEAAGSLMYRSANPSLDRAVYAARSYTQIGGSVPCGRYSPLLAPPTGGTDSTYSGQDAYCGTYPNASSNGLVVSPLLLLEGVSAATANWRGVFPGIYHSPQKISAGTFSTGDLVSAQGNLAGRKLMAFTGPAGGGPLTATLFIDVTGPWR